MPLRVSVVVPTCGRAELLARCLDALENQSLPREEYEIIVVDDRALRTGPAATRGLPGRCATGLRSCEPARRKPSFMS